MVAYGFDIERYFSVYSFRKILQDFAESGIINSIGKY